MATKTFTGDPFSDASNFAGATPWAKKSRSNNLINRSAELPIERINPSAPQEKSKQNQIVIKVLIVDNSSLIFKALSQVKIINPDHPEPIHIEYVNNTHVATGKPALELFEVLHPDLVLIDYQIVAAPDAAELYRHIKVRPGLAVPIIGIPFTEKNIINFYRNSGFNNILLKKQVEKNQLYYDMQEYVNLVADIAAMKYKNISLSAVGEFRCAILPKSLPEEKMMPDVDNSNNGLEQYVDAQSMSSANQPDNIYNSAEQTHEYTNAASFHADQYEPLNNISSHGKDAADRKIYADTISQRQGDYESQYSDYPSGNSQKENMQAVRGIGAAENQSFDSGISAELVEEIIRAIQARGLAPMPVPSNNAAPPNHFQQAHKASNAIHTPEGEVFTVTGVKGGAGKTLIATNQAALLAEAIKGKGDVCLLGLDFVACSLDVYIPHEYWSSKNITDLIRDGYNQEIQCFDENLLEEVIFRAERPDNLYVLPGIRVANEAEGITPEHIDILINQLKRRFRYIVIDTNANPTDTRIQVAIEISTFVFIVTQCELASARNTRNFLLMLTHIANRDPNHPVAKFLAKAKLVINQSITAGDFNRQFCEALFYEKENTIGFIQEPFVIGRIPLDTKSVLQAVNENALLIHSLANSLIIGAMKAQFKVFASLIGLMRGKQERSSSNSTVRRPRPEPARKRTSKAAKITIPADEWAEDIPDVFAEEETPKKSWFGNIMNSLIGKRRKNR